MKTLRWWPILLTACLLLPFSQPALGLPPAAPPQAPALGPWIDIWMGMDVVDNYSPAVAYNSRHDEYLVVWVDEVDDYTWRISARRVGGRGQLLSWFVVASFAGKRCTEPHVAYSPQQDRYMVVYTYEFSFTDHDIYAQMVAGDGSGPLGSPVPIVTNGFNQHEPAIAHNSQDDEFLVAYTNQDAPGQADVYLDRRASDDGDPLAPWQAVPGGGMGVTRYSPALAYDPQRNQYLVTYGAEAAGPGDVRSSLVSADLNTFNAELHVWDHTAEMFAITSRVAAGPDEYMVVWTGVQTAPPPPMSTRMNGYARRVNSAGVPQGAAMPLTSGTHPYDLRPATDVALTVGYGYLVGLGRGQSTGAEFDTYARYVLLGAQALADEFAIDASTGIAWDEAIACSPAGTCLAVETYRSASYAKLDIRGRLISVRHAYLPVTLR